MESYQTDGFLETIFPPAYGMGIDFRAMATSRLAHALLPGGFISPGYRPGELFQL
ncbi:hypothetical protein SAMN05216311_104222 [Chitinophaga sp. CF418]|nr:hypothetical protein SAMN05216311_104222 [Chitinophaga sp. CF418]